MDTKLLKKECDEITTRKLKDMRDRFKSCAGENPNKILYKVYIKDFGTFKTGLTIIEPGTINKEFHMTKGHKHKKKREEIYILSNGKGKLLLEGTKNKIIELKKDKPVLIPATAGHRLINTGKTKMEVLTIYAKDAGHNYTFNFKKRIFQR